MSLSRRTIVSGSLAMPLISGTMGKATNSLPYASREYEFLALADEDLPLNPPSRTNAAQSAALNSSGVYERLVDGEVVTHPVAHTQFIMKLLRDYRFFDDEEALQLAERNAEVLIVNGVQVQDALYLPYSFDMLESDGSIQLAAPWYSGMAQGQALQVVTRLWRLTGDSRWHDAAQALFRGFTYVNDDSKPWAPKVEQFDTLWFEEYPTDPPMAVFNGHVFACFGLYEYWLEFADQTALDLLRGGFFTVERLGQSIRNPGRYSAYNLSRRTVKRGYHNVHVAILLTMYSMTADPVFAHLHDDFYDDANPGIGLHMNLVLPAGDVDAFTIWARGTLKSNEIISVEEDTPVTVTERLRVIGANSYGYLVREEQFEGLVIREQPSGVVVDGLVRGYRNSYGPLYGTIRYYRPSRMALFLIKQGPGTVYENNDGELGADVTGDVELSFARPVEVLARGISNGQELSLVRMEDAEYWISGTPRWLDREQVYVWE